MHRFLDFFQFGAKAQRVPASAEEVQDFVDSVKAFESRIFQDFRERLSSVYARFLEPPLSDFYVHVFGTECDVNGIVGDIWNQVNTCMKSDRDPLVRLYRADRELGQRAHLLCICFWSNVMNLLKHLMLASVTLIESVAEDSSDDFRKQQVFERAVLSVELSIANVDIQLRELYDAWLVAPDAECPQSVQDFFNDVPVLQGKIVSLFEPGSEGFEPVGSVDESARIRFSALFVLSGGEVTEKMCEIARKFGVYSHLRGNCAAFDAEPVEWNTDVGNRECKRVTREFDGKLVVRAAKHLPAFHMDAATARTVVARFNETTVESSVGFKTAGDLIKDFVFWTTQGMCNFFGNYIMPYGTDLGVFCRDWFEQCLDIASSYVYAPTRKFMHLNWLDETSWCMAMRNIKTHYEEILEDLIAKRSQDVVDYLMDEYNLDNEDMEASILFRSRDLLRILVQCGVNHPPVNVDWDVDKRAVFCWQDDPYDENSVKLTVFPGLRHADRVVAPCIVEYVRKKNDLIYNVVMSQL